MKSLRPILTLAACALALLSCANAVEIKSDPPPSADPPETLLLIADAPNAVDFCRLDFRVEDVPIYEIDCSAVDAPDVAQCEEDRGLVLVAAPAPVPEHAPPPGCTSTAYATCAQPPALGPPA